MTTSDHCDNECYKNVPENFIGVRPAAEFDKTPNFTDLGNAERFAREYGDSIRFCEDYKEPWLIWTGKYWKPGSVLAVAKVLPKFISGFAKEAEKTEDRDKRAKLYKAAYLLEDATNTQGMLYFAKSFLSIEETKLNNDFEIVNFENGTLNMRTKELSAHNPDMYLTRIIHHDYNPEAGCRKWLEFMNFSFDKETVKWVQKALGWTLAGRSDGRMFPFLFGDGGNGKSTFKEVMLEIFGEYARTIPVEIILTHRSARDGEAPMAFLRSLEDGRLVFTSEIPKGRSIATEIVKDMTGGDTLKFRGQHELTPKEFPPTHVLWVYGNNKPKIPENTAGIWDRVRLVPFTRRIPDNMRLPMEEVKAAFRLEAEGIIAWIVDGYQLAIKEGLDPSIAIAKESGLYRKEEDDLGRFIDEKFIKGDDLKVDKKRFCMAYIEWLKEENIRSIPTITAITQDMERKEFERSEDRRYYMGLNFAPPPETETPGTSQVIP